MLEEKETTLYYCTVHKSNPFGFLTCRSEVPPGDDRLRTPICHANQGHIAALIHGDVRGDIGDLWWNCEDKRKFDLVRSRIMEGSLPGLLICLSINQSQVQTRLTGFTPLTSTWVSEITSE